MPTSTHVDTATITTAALATYRAAHADSNDHEIEALQDFRDLVLTILGIDPIALADQAEAEANTHH